MLTAALRGCCVPELLMRQTHSGRADGRWIYFSREQSPAIWKVPADGGNAVRLTDTDGFNPQESADGARIYFVCGHDRTELWWVPASGGSSLRLEGMPTLVSGDQPANPTSSSDRD